MVTLHYMARSGHLLPPHQLEEKTNAGRPPELGADLYLQYRRGGTQSRAAATNKRPVLASSSLHLTAQTQNLINNLADKTP